MPRETDSPPSDGDPWGRRTIPDRRAQLAHFLSLMSSADENNIAPGETGRPAAEVAEVASAMLTLSEQATERRGTRRQETPVPAALGTFPSRLEKTVYERHATLQAIRLAMLREPHDSVSKPPASGSGSEEGPDTLPLSAHSPSSATLAGKDPPAPEQPAPSISVLPEPVESDSPAPVPRVPRASISPSPEPPTSPVIPVPHESPSPVITPPTPTPLSMEVTSEPLDKPSAPTPPSPQPPIAVSSDPAAPASAGDPITASLEAPVAASPEPPISPSLQPPIPPREPPCLAQVPISVAASTDPPISPSLQPPIPPSREPPCLATVPISAESAGTKEAARPPRLPRLTGFRSQPAPLSTTWYTQSNSISTTEVQDAGPWDSFRPLLDGTMKSICEAFKAEMELRNGILHRESYNPVAGCSSVVDKWQACLFHDMAASERRDLISPSTKEIPYETLASNIFSRSGYIVNILRRTDHRASWSQCLNAMDCVTQVIGSGEVRIFTCMATDEFYTRYQISSLRVDSFLVPVVALATDYCCPSVHDLLRPGDLYRSGSLRHSISRINSLEIYRNPRTHLSRCLATLFAGSASEIRELTEAATRSRQERIQDAKLRDALSFIRTLKEGYNFVNEEQAAIMARCVTNVVSWKRDNRRSELDRFLIIQGVPGCGKTYTLVYTVASLLQCFHPEFREGDHHSSNLSVQLLIVTKTNKALDVVCERLERMKLPGSDGVCMTRIKSIPFYCSRSARYMEDGRRRRPLQKRARSEYPSKIPVILSTFGNLSNLMKQLQSEFAAHPSKWSEHVREKLKVLIIDEGSQIRGDDLSLFLYYFPDFDGIIIIFGDRHQMGPVVLCGSEEVRRYLSRSLFHVLSDGAGGYFVPDISMYTQYRMHPDIMHFANDVTYSSAMRYGGNFREHDAFPARLFIEGFSQGRVYPLAVNPVVMVSTSESSSHMFRCEGESNIDECKLALVYIDKLTGGHAPVVREEQIVFLSVYADQCNIMAWLCGMLNLRIRVHSISSYQGEENDVVLYSLVRRPDAGIGISNEDTLVTVAITRAKKSLIILGDLKYFAKSVDGTSIWAAVQDSIEKRGFKKLDAAEILSFRTELVEMATDILRTFGVPNTTLVRAR